MYFYKYFIVYFIIIIFISKFISILKISFSLLYIFKIKYFIYTKTHVLEQI